MLTAHLTILAVTLAVVAYSDHLGWQYVRGTRKVLDARLTTTLHNIVWAGLLGMIGTGLWMAWPALPVLFTNPTFVLKMAFVAAFVVNAVFIGILMKVAFTTPYAELPKEKKTPLMISGAVSTISWIGAVLSAMLSFGNIFSWLGV